MWLGYFKLGNLEIGNSSRVTAYARRNGLSWVKDPGNCDTLDALMPRLPESRALSRRYTSVDADPAPWYDPSNPDTEGFYGGMVISIEGLYGSTRTVRMSSSVSGGAVSGQTYHRMREMVARVILVAKDQCALEAGTAWLGMDSGVATECNGVDLLFWDCCPCACLPITGPLPGENDVPWDLALGTWDEQVRNWDIPSPAADLFEGTIDEQVLTFDQAEVGLDGCVADCMLPYRRHLRNVQMVGGPTVIRELQNLPCGVAREVEILMTAGDPAHYSDTEPVVAMATLGTGARIMDADLPRRPALAERFGVLPGRTLPHMRAAPSVARREWVTGRFGTGMPDSFPDVMAGVLPVLSVSGDDVRDVRLSLMQGGEKVVSWFVPLLPHGVEVVLDTVSRQALARSGQREEVLPGVVRSGDGGPPRWPGRLGRDSFDVVVDKADASPVKVVVGLTAVGDG